MRYFLENSNFVIEVESKGAEVKSVLNKAEYRQYVWYGNPVFWGRTSPVLFPFVGSLKNKQYVLNGKTMPMGQHGFARDMEHKLIEQSASELRFRLESNESSMEKYPFPFSLDTVYTLCEDTLTVRWEVHNPGTDTLPFSIGAHPAFLCPIHGEPNKAGYKLCFDGVTEIHHRGNSRANGLALNENLSLPLKDGIAEITAEFFDRCTYIIEGGQCGSVGLEDPAGRRFVTVKFDTPLFAIWSPEEKNAPFVCIEPWYGRCDAVDFDGDIFSREFTNLLQPDEQFSGGYEIKFG